MSDGLNDARAIRVAEIMSDFRNLQYYIAQVTAQAQPSAEEYYLEGYSLLRQCALEAQQVLQRQYAATGTTVSPNGNQERQRTQLRGVIVDAAVRRFQCQRAYLRAHAGLRWINSRGVVLQGAKPSAMHMAALMGVDQTLRAELAAITDQHVENTLQAQDAAEGKWLVEDPPLATILHIISTAR